MKAEMVRLISEDHEVRGVIIGAVFVNVVDYFVCEGEHGGNDLPCNSLALA
jgi:hypothetical protein